MSLGSFNPGSVRWWRCCCCCCLLRLSLCSSCWLLSRGAPDSTHACCVAGWRGLLWAACAAAGTAIALADCRHWLTYSALPATLNTQGVGGGRGSCMQSLKGTPWRSRRTGTAVVISCGSSEMWEEKPPLHHHGIDRGPVWEPKNKTLGGWRGVDVLSRVVL